MAIRWSPDFLDLLTALNAADARYLLVGGHAIGLFARPRARREEHDLDGVRCHVIARDDLIANKRAAGRPQDLADVRALERASKK